MSFQSLYWFNKLLDFGLDSYDLFSDDILPVEIFSHFADNIINTNVDFNDQFLTSLVCSFSDVLYFRDLSAPRVFFEDIVSYFELDDEIFEVFSNIFSEYLYDTLLFNFDLFYSPAFFLSDVLKFFVEYQYYFYHTYSTSETILFFTSDAVTCFSTDSYFTCYGVSNLYRLEVYERFMLSFIAKGFHAFMDGLKFFSSFDYTIGSGVSSFLNFDIFLSVVYRFLSTVASDFVMFDSLTSSVSLNTNVSFDFSSFCSLLQTDVAVSDLILSDVFSFGIRVLIGDIYVLNDQIGVDSGNYVFVNFLFDDYVKLVLSSFLRSKLVLDFSVVPIFVAYGNFSDVLDYSGFLFELGKGLERFGSKVVFVFYDLGFLDSNRSSGDRGISVYVFDKEVTGFSDVITAIDGVYEFGGEEVGGSVVFSLEGVGEQREKRIDRIFHGGRVSSADVYADGLWFHYNFDRDNSLVVGKGLVGEEVKVVLDNVFELDWVKVRLDLLKRAKYT